jgi:hypothetical protein
MMKKTIFYKRKQAFLNESLNSGDQQFHQYHKKRPRYIKLEIQSQQCGGGDASEIDICYFIPATLYLFHNS